MGLSAFKHHKDAETGLGSWIHTAARFGVWLHQRQEMIASHGYRADPEEITPCNEMVFKSLHFDGLSIEQELQLVHEKPL